MRKKFFLLTVIAVGVIIWRFDVNVVQFLDRVSDFMHTPIMNLAR